MYLASWLIIIKDLAGKFTIIGSVRSKSSIWTKFIITSEPNDKDRIVSSQQSWLSTWGGIPWPKKYKKKLKKKKKWKIVYLVSNDWPYIGQANAFGILDQVIFESVASRIPEKVQFWRHFHRRSCLIHKQTPCRNV